MVLGLSALSEPSLPPPGRPPGCPPPALPGPRGAELARVLTRPAPAPAAARRRLPGTALMTSVHKEGYHWLYSRVIRSWELHRKSLCNRYLYRQKTLM